MTTHIRSITARLVILAALIIAPLFFTAHSAPSFAQSVVPTPVNVTASRNAKISNGTCGATIVAGKVLYLDQSTGTLKIASNATSASALIAGVALGGCASGQTVRYATFDPDFVPGFAVTVGATYFLDGTSGGWVATVLNTPTTAT